MRGVRLAWVSLFACAALAVIPRTAPAAEGARPPRWTADTQSGRDCRLTVSGFIGLGGLHAGFWLHPKSALSFIPWADPPAFPDGGVFRIELPGAAQPWLIDTESKTVKPDGRDRTLLTELERLKPMRMTFSPHGGKASELRTATAGLAVASAMFEACAVAVNRAALPPQLSFSELRYAISEYDDACELAGTFQLQGNGLWLTLVSDGKKNVLKVTRRTLKAGYVIAALDLGKLGGPKNLTAEDATIELDAPAFAALRRDLVNQGRDFQIMMARGQGYTVQFGGAYAVVEAPMFDACARVKFAAPK